MTHPLAGLVLLFSRVAQPANAARLHAASCSVVKGARRTTIISPAVDVELQTEVDDLNERGFPVRRCRCCEVVS